MIDWKSIHNPADLKVGEKVLTDKGRPNACEVEIISLTPNHTFAKVFPFKGAKDEAWELMTNRLSRINN